MVKIDYHKIYKKMIHRLVLTSLFLFIIILSKQFFVQYQINNEENMSYIMNISGRQRMLSQKVVKGILFIRENQIDTDEALYINALKADLDLWKDSHYELIYLNERKISINDNNEIYQMYQDIEPELLNIYDKANIILEELDKPNSDGNLINESFNEIKTSEKKYLKNMDTIVSRYEYQARQSMEFIKTAHMILFLIIAILLIYIVIMIFNPILNYFKKAFFEVIDSNKNLIRMFNTLSGAFFVVDEEGRILFNNKDAENVLSRENEDSNTQFISKSIKWLSLDIMQIIDKVKGHDDRVDNIETVIEDRDGNVMSVLISVVSGKYEGSESIMISMFDITTQKKAEIVLKETAIRDELTGLYNRHFLNEIINLEISRAQRYEIPFAAVLLDIDNFKMINDNWGHPVGDSVLQFTAEILKKNLRRVDYAIRIGGEEFLIIMPNTTSKGATIAAEKIRKLIEKETHPIIGKYTASFGASALKSGEEYHDLYMRIDEALYKAKDKGKNNVVEVQGLGLENSIISGEWNKEWECGEKNIDDQHRELFQMYIQYSDSPYLSDDKEAELNYLDDIIKYLTIHFSYEEKALKEIGYKSLLEHKQMHNQLLNKAKEARYAVQMNTIEKTKAILYIFDEVIVEHLLCEDIKFYSYFQRVKV